MWCRPSRVTLSTMYALYVGRETWNYTGMWSVKGPFFFSPLFFSIKRTAFSNKYFLSFGGSPIDERCCSQILWQASWDDTLLKEKKNVYFSPLLKRLTQSANHNNRLCNWHFNDTLNAWWSANADIKKTVEEWICRKVAGFVVIVKIRWRRSSKKKNTIFCSLFSRIFGRNLEVLLLFCIILNNSCC